MGTDKKIKIEIRYGDDEMYHVSLNGNDFKFCRSYNELAHCIGNLIKSSCKRVTKEFEYE